MNTSILHFPHLLTPPIKRAAYSDRTGWLMAELSKLAYSPFETVSPEGDRMGMAVLQDQLAQLHCKLVRTFSVHVPWRADTQAFLALMDQGGRDPFLVLSFRGTEGQKLEDIKTDLSAKALVLGRRPDGQVLRVHPGFWRAFEAVRPDVENVLSYDTFKNLPLYITGHSLGGALAVIATYVLASDRVAACYTFGAPRVANLAFGQSIKVPIYRFINANDIVPRLLPGMALDVLLSALRLFSSFPFARQFVNGLERYGAYRHFGDLRYFVGGREMSVPDGKPAYQDLALCANPPQLQRWWWGVRRFLCFGPQVMFGDHKIDQYIRKLACWADARLIDEVN